MDELSKILDDADKIIPTQSLYHNMIPGQAIHLYVPAGLVQIKKSGEEISLSYWPSGKDEGSAALGVTYAKPEETSVNSTTITIPGGIDETIGASGKNLGRIQAEWFEQTPYKNEREVFQTFLSACFELFNLSKSGNEK